MIDSVIVLVTQLQFTVMHASQHFSIRFNQCIHESVIK